MTDDEHLAVEVAQLRMWGMSEAEVKALLEEELSALQSSPGNLKREAAT